MGNFIFRIGETEDGKAVKMDLQVLIATKIGIIANSGGGKSYALRVLIERTGEHVQWVLLDHGGEFSSLRKMFPDMLLVGADGELPVDVRSANLLARKIMETHVSTIIDLYGLRKIRAPWAAKFLDTLNTLPKSLQTPIIIAIDEAHLIAPETPSGTKEERALLMGSREQVCLLADSGRKEMRGAAILSQRVSKLATDARAELRNRLVGLAVQDLDRERSADDLGMAKRDALQLRELNAGEFFAFGPAFLHKGIVKMRVDPSATPHPNPGEHRIWKIPPAGNALKLIVEQLGDLPAQAQVEAHTLEQLQKENARVKNELAARERELKARPVEIKPAAPQIKIEYVDRPILNGEVKDFIMSANALRATLDEFPARLAQSLQPTISPVVSNLALILGKIEQVQRAQVTAPKEFVRIPPPARQYVVTPRQDTGKERGDSWENLQANAARVRDAFPKLPEGELKILKVCAQFPDGATRKQLTVLTTFKRSTRDAYILRLKNKGLVTDAERIRPTDAGLAELGHQFEPLPTGEALIAYWRAHLPIGEAAIFDCALAAYPSWIDKTRLDEMTPFKRSTRDAYISRMVAKQIIDERTGEIKVSDELFD